MRGKGELTWMEQSVNRLRVITDWPRSSDSVYLPSFILYKAMYIFLELYPLRQNQLAKKSLGPSQKNNSTVACLQASTLQIRFTVFAGFLSLRESSSSSRKDTLDHWVFVKNMV